VVARHSDSVPSHRSQHAVAFLQTNVPDLLSHCPLHWPPNSPDPSSAAVTTWQAIGCPGQPRCAISVYIWSSPDHSGSR